MVAAVLKSLQRVGLFALIVGSFYRFLPAQVFAQELTSPPANILLVNQVRGAECCQAGSSSTLLQQLTIAQSLNLPTTFSLRYDVLNDLDFLAIIRATQDSDLIRWGLFFEVTPMLAEDAEVPYDGTPATWSRAQHAFPLGYTPDERLRLLNTVMAKYLEVFQEKPELVTAWMLDATTAQLLKNTYGVNLVQITREQWGTDSYTLYGGPVHYPYRASNSWLLAPSQSDANILVIRQTITDPLWNYGDRFSRFTSQPNDFTQDGKSIEYFRSLLEQTINQPVGQRGWGLIGLENSMEDDYQQLYSQQLKIVAELRDQNKLQVTTPNQLTKTKRTSVEMYTGSDLVRGTNAKVAWITTPVYQARVRLDENQLYIDDLRLYSESISDPYVNSPARSRGYWITPFLLDGSRFNQAENQENYQAWEKGVISPLDPTNDVSSSPQRLELGSVNQIESKLWNEYWSKTNNNVQFFDGEKKIIFSSNSILLENWTIDEIKYVAPSEITPSTTFNREENSFNLTWSNLEKDAWKLIGNCEDDSCELSFSISAQAAIDSRNLFPAFMFPEQLVNVVDSAKSTIYLHNQYVVKGKQLARIVFIPRSTSGISVEIDHPLKFQTSNTLSLDEVRPDMLSQPVQFYDFSALEPGETMISTSDYDLNFSASVSVAPDCKKEILVCATHPKWLIWYIQSFIQSRVQLQEQSELPWLKV